MRFSKTHILIYSSNLGLISDLGLCKPINYYSSTDKNDIYGVLPYVAPEVLRGNPYTPASDIYSFGMIMWEFMSGVSPFDDRAHDLQLSLSICKGKRPEIIENTPQCYIDLMKKCWDEDPLKRPSSKEVVYIIKNWVFLSNGENNVENISKELKSNIMEFINAPIGHNKPIIKSHSQDILQSSSWKFKITTRLTEEIQASHSGHN